MRNYHTDIEPTFHDIKHSEWLFQVNGQSQSFYIFLLLNQIHKLLFSVNNVK